MTMSIIEPTALADGTFARATTGTYYDAAGVLQTAAINVPRLNYDPANLTAAPQLLVEAAEKNWVLHSEDLTNAIWTKQNVTVTANTTLAPDGQLTADTITNDATNGEHRVYQSFSTGALNSTAIYLKAGTANFASLGRGVNSLYAVIDLTSGAVVSSTGCAPVVTPAANGFWRIDIKNTSGIDISFLVVCMGETAAQAVPQAPYIGTGKTIIVWGGVARLGAAAATSYNPTTTATVTRAADIVSTTGLVYSTAAENDFPLWLTNTPQIVGDKVIRPTTHRIYQRLVAGTTATAPELDAINWLDIAPTNRHAMFDDVVGTMTTAADSLTVVLRPGSVGGLGLLDMVGGRVTLVMKDKPGGVVIYNKTVQLDVTVIDDVYDWLYKPTEQLTDVAFTDLPFQFVGNEMTITIGGAAVVGIGVCKFGDLSVIGQTQYGASVGIASFSKKGFDAFGNATLKKGAFSKRLDFSVVTEPRNFNSIFRKLASIDAVACIYIGTDAAGLEPLIAYGFYKDFLMVVPYKSHHLCTASIESLT